MPFNIFLPSYNRACQLHLLLESLNENAKNLFQCFISYDYSDEEYCAGYNKLKNSALGQDHIWFKRKNYGLDYKEFLDENKFRLVGHIVDDMIFYRKTSVYEDEIREILLDDLSVWAFNFRVGLNICITDYANQIRILLPKYEIVKDKYMKWNYRTCAPNPWASYFAFELPVDGFIFRANDILWMCEDEDYSSWRFPLDYEDRICHNGKRDEHKKHYMIAPLCSEVFAQHINSAANTGHRSVTNFAPNTRELNNMYLNGYVIDLNSFDFSNINSAHDEKAFRFRRNNDK